LEIGIDKDHVHFLVQSVPTYSVTNLHDREWSQRRMKIT
jgi:REP element-mobilizing transposase RayT